VTPSLRVADRTQRAADVRIATRTTAFLFRAQSEFSDVREAMAAAAPALIVTMPAADLDHIYSSSDPISGRLDYYDAPATTRRPGASRAVFNVRDDQGWIPFVGTRSTDEQAS